MDRLRALAMHRTWRWRPDATDPDHYRALETTEGGLRYFAWSHLDEGLSQELQQTFEAFAEEGPRWPLPENVARELRTWLERHHGE
jgi:hypothetical protein